LKKIYIFNIFVFFFIILFCSLGSWQLYRLQWKQDLISQINSGLNSKPIEYTNQITKNYQRVKASGRYDFSNQIYLYSLNDKGQPGYDVITPFLIPNKKNILVNRGWIKKEFKYSDKINYNSKNIQGLMREVSKGNIFTPENDIENNIWFLIDLDEINNLTGLKFNKLILYLEDNEITAPNPKKITIDLPNNHLKYAITWYAISVSIFFYYLYFRRTK